jgi:hypothetical protein
VLACSRREHFILKGKSQMSDQKKVLAGKLMRDIVLIDIDHHPDWKVAGREWAERLKAVHPYNVVCFRPGDDLTSFGARLTDADCAALESHGALLLKPQTVGQA